MHRILKPPENDDYKSPLEREILLRHERMNEGETEETDGSPRLFLTTIETRKHAFASSPPESSEYGNFLSD